MDPTHSTPSPTLQAIERAQLREVRDELLRRARGAETLVSNAARTPQGLAAAALNARMAETFREAAELADAKLRGAS